MNAHSLIPWFMGASLAGFGVVLPLAIGQNPENEAIVYILRGLGFTGFAAGIVTLIRTSGESAPGASAADAEAIVPRTLCNNPLAAGHGTVPLAERIDMAAEASSLYGRSFGVIYYNLDSYERVARSHGAAAANAAMNFVLGMLQMVVRGTDRAECVDAGRFIVCVALLPDQSSLQQVRDRVARAMSKMRIEALDDSIEYDSGAAIYPVHARSGADLIAHARRECEVARERRLLAQAPQRKAAASVGQSCAA
jgi:GGDEF domain-containing protein